MSIMSPSPLETDPFGLPLEGLDEYPHFSESVRHYKEELTDYLTQLREETTSEIPEGYIEEYNCWDIDAANPHMAIPLFLKRHGAPIAITETVESSNEGPESELSTSSFAIWLDPQIKDGYKEMWSAMFHQDTRQLANSMSRSGITPYEAFPDGYEAMPLMSHYIIWAHGQGILKRAYVTSKLHQYLANGADPHTLGSITNSVSGEGRLADELIANGTMPFALESVLGMGVATASKALTEHPKFIDKLHLNPVDLPQIDLDKLDYSSNQFEKDYISYWEPLVDLQPAFDKTHTNNHTG